LISIGGGGGPDYSKVLNSEAVDGFCKKIIDFIDKYNLDGLDVDIEGNMIVEDQYKRFISKISPMMKKEKKLLTCALGWYRRERIKKETLDKFDFVNIMAYDETGAWNPNRPGQHSSVAWAKRNLDYWHKKGVPKEKLVLGVPFYGKDFTKDKKVIGMKYWEILEKHPEAHSKDEIGNLYYNGKATIKKKCGIAKEYGGIMVWEITQDSNDKHSLLDVIHKNIKR
jgi:chitinase